MNRYLVLVGLVALVGVVSANPVLVEDDQPSQLKLVPEDSEETAQLEGKLQVFTDFCLDARDYVVKDIRGRSGSKAASIFNVIFSGAEELGKEAYSVQREAVEILSNQIRDPEQPINKETDAPNKAVVQGQEALQEKGLAPVTFLQAITSTLAATKNAVTSKVLTKFEEFKGMIGLGSFVNALKEVCGLVDHYDQTIQEKFDTFKARLEDEELKRTKLQQVPCVTVRRVTRIDGICKFAQAAQQPLIKAITYKSDN